MIWRNDVTVTLCIDVTLHFTSPVCLLFNRLFSVVVKEGDCFVKQISSLEMRIWYFLVWCPKKTTFLLGSWTWTWCVSGSKSSNWRYRGKKAKAYIYPLLSLRWRSNFRLKPANEHPEIISSSKMFHSFTTLLLKENWRSSIHCCLPGNCWRLIFGRDVTICALQTPCSYYK